MPPVLPQLSQQDVVKRYLLGSLSEDERDRFEQQFFSDNALFEEVELAEDDLVDRYIRKELTDDDRQLFEQALSGSPRLYERVEFAKLFASKTASQTTRPEPLTRTAPEKGFWQRLFAPENQSVRLAYGFAVLLLVIGGVAVAIAWMNLRQQSAGLAARNAELQQRSEEANRKINEMQARNEQQATDLERQKTDLDAERQSIKEQIESFNRPQNLIAQLTLKPGATRSADTRSKFTLQRYYSSLNIKLELLDADYPRYRAVVLDPDQKQVSKPQNLTPKSTASGKYLNLLLPLKGVAAGDYRVHVDGIDKSGKIEPVDDYPFQITSPSR